MGNVAGGSLTLTFTADSFASMIKTVTIDLGNYSGDSYTETVLIYLPKLDKTLNTTVYEQLGSLYMPAANVPYQIDLGSQYIDRIITGTTNADGKISQGKLPDVYLELRVDFEKNGIKYGIDTYSGSQYGYPEEFSSEVSVAEKTSEGSLFITAANIFDDEGMPAKDFARGDDITMDFSAPIDLDYSMTTTRLYKASYTLVATDITWSDNNTTLTMDPIGDSLDVGGSYYVELRLRAVNGNYLNNYSYYQDFEFMVEAEGEITDLEKVGTLTLEYPTTITNTTNVVQISFSEVEGADRYEVYGQYESGEYLYFDYFYDGYIGDGIVNSDYIYLTDLPGIEVPPGGLFSDGAIYKLIVRAVDTYNNIYGTFSDPLVLSAK